MASIEYNNKSEYCLKEELLVDLRVVWLVQQQVL
jgi:hypothetical protein